MEKVYLSSSYFSIIIEKERRGQIPTQYLLCEQALFISNAEQMFHLKEFGGGGVRAANQDLLFILIPV